MLPPITAAAAAAAAATAAAALALAWLRERDARDAAERFAAASLQSLLYAMDANDAETGRHVRRVATSALVLARAAGLDEVARREVERVALFHDIGKIAAALFDVVHDDAGPLTQADRQAIASHPRRGSEVLAPLAPFYPRLANDVLSHHERWDGGGYPRGLAGSEIPLAARIVAIADSFDAVTHTRRYRPGRSRSEGREAIRRGRGTQFDPLLVDLFLSPTVQRGVRLAEQEIGRSRSQGRRRRRRRARAPEIDFRWREPGAVTPDGPHSGEEHGAAAGRQSGDVAPAPAPARAPRPSRA